ncbi:hypothetical protein OEZ86_013408 [Tetradesmus obliquus]|nr:hypothetical protein OEZ86_013408 [Tetradesmus obliquus]
MRASLSTKKAGKQHLNGWLPQQRPGHPPSPAHIAAAAVAFLAVLCCCIYGVRTFRLHLLVQNVLDSPITEPQGHLVLHAQQHAANEMLLRQLVEECAKQQQSVIHLDSQRRMVTSSSINPQHCPALDVVLPASERVFGTCTDAALYIIHVGGRLIPLPPDVEAYDNYCGAQTASDGLIPLPPDVGAYDGHCGAQTAR